MRRRWAGCPSRPEARRPGRYGGAVEDDRTQVLLVDLAGVLFRFDHEHRLNVLGERFGLPPGRVRSADFRP